jgi:hypothetical protein
MGCPYDTPLGPREATERLRRIAWSNPDLRWTKHAKERLQGRGLLIGDVLHVLKHGFVYEPGEAATRPGCFKYKMESNTPNSTGRIVRIVVIPSTTNGVKLVTVMWVDE